MRRFAGLCLVAAALATVSCRQSTASDAIPEPAVTSDKAAGANQPATPGLGEIMTLQQMRHLKLWFAGEAENWELANYEIKELREGFDEVVKYHPTHEDSPIAPKDAVPKIIMTPITNVQAAIQAKDKKMFEEKFDALTADCNNCHNVMNFGYNVVQRPTSNPYANQNFFVVEKR